MMRLPTLHATWLVATLAATLPSQWFSTFETPPTRLLAIDAGGSRLLALNSADQKLLVFTLRDATWPVLLREIPVGLEPVAVAVRNEREAWVVNRLSDTISIVAIDDGELLATLRTGDEPADVAFAGAPERAFVSLAGRHQVQVFDAASRAPVATIDVFGDQPTALAVSGDRSKVWAVVHRSGNRTTILPEHLAPPQPPPTNPKLPAAPPAPRVIDCDDPLYKAKIDVRLPDIDVVEIDAASARIRRDYRRVGTINFGLAVGPGDELWVANTEARNLIHLEPNLRGHVADNRVTQIVTGDRPSVVPHDLNPGIDYRTIDDPEARKIALAQPTDAAFDPRGERLYVAAFGSDRIAVLDRSGRVRDRIEIGDVHGAGADPARKRGPRSLVHHPSETILYVANRLSNTLAVVSTRHRQRLRELPLGFDPTPAAIKAGRDYFYDARLSGNGTMSCASCHVDARTDGLAWDLGDPMGEMVVLEDESRQVTRELHPMKGPMLTQSLLGLRGELPLHWRGDRRALQEFNSAFSTLLGGKTLDGPALTQLTTFLEATVHHPNPHQNLDRTYSSEPQGESAREGEHYFRTANFAGKPGGESCAFCHERDSGGSSRILADETTTQYFAVAKLRGLYMRTGNAPVAGERRAGFGFLHDGTQPSLYEMLGADTEFFGVLAQDARRKRMLERFLLAFDTGTAPIVGRGRLVATPDVARQDVAADLALFVAQARARNASLVARGRLHGVQRGFRYDVALDAFVPDRAAEGPVTLPALLQAIATGAGSLSFTAVLPHDGVRLGIDRDGDGVRDGDEAATAYGQSTPACARRVELAANTAPELGSSLFALVAHRLPANARGVWMLGRASTRFDCFDLTVLVEPIGAVLLPCDGDAAGTAVLPLPIPARAELVGTRLFAQVVAGAKCSGSGLLASNGLGLRLSR